jgi:glycine betaine/proline transport system permease protein
LTGIQRLDVGTGFEGGLAVVILAVVLDRITQSFGKERPAFWRTFFPKAARQQTEQAPA